MSLSILCASCGLRFMLPDKLGRPKKVRCPKCDAVCEVGSAPRPEAVPAQEKMPAPIDKVPVCPECGERMSVTADQPPRCGKCTPQVKPPSKSPRRVSVQVPTTIRAVQDSRIEGTEEEDDNPYSVPADPQQKEPCPHCQKMVPLGIVICNHCGFDRQTVTVLQRDYKKVAKQWDVGLPLHIRVNVFLLFAASSLIAGLIYAFMQDGVVGFLMGWPCFGLLLAFLLGSFPRIELSRSKKGQVRLRKIWRFCFIACAPANIQWRGHDGIGVRRFHKSEFLEWIVFIFLFPFGIIPAIVWWICIINADQYEVSLTRDHGTPAQLIYRGRSEAMANDIAANLRNVTGLP